MNDDFDNNNLYEGLFLMNQSAVGGGMGAAIEHVREILGRIDAEVITLRKWEDRKLSYPIKRQKRGIYLLSMFRADGTRLSEVENTCNLSEQVLRLMVTKCDHIGQVEYDAELEEAKTSEAELKLREQKAEQADEAKATEAKAAEAKKATEAKAAEAKSAPVEAAAGAAEPATSESVE
jgi:small subunit ribosomal protein S6